jgi:hypothetical protein
MSGYGISDSIKRRLFGCHVHQLQWIGSVVNSVYAIILLALGGAGFLITWSCILDAFFKLYLGFRWRRKSSPTQTTDFQTLEDEPSSGSPGAGANAATPGQASFQVESERRWDRNFSSISYGWDMVHLILELLGLVLIILLALFGEWSLQWGLLFDIVPLLVFSTSLACSLVTFHKVRGEQWGPGEPFVYHAPPPPPTAVHGTPGQPQMVPMQMYPPGGVQPGAGAPMQVVVVPYGQPPPQNIQPVYQPSQYGQAYPAQAYPAPAQSYPAQSYPAPAQSYPAQQNAYPYGGPSPAQPGVGNERAAQSMSPSSPAVGSGGANTSGGASAYPAYPASPSSSTKSV